MNINLNSISNEIAGVSEAFENFNLDYVIVDCEGTAKSLQALGYKVVPQFVHDTELQNSWIILNPDSYISDPIAKIHYIDTDGNEVFMFCPNYDDSIVENIKRLTHYHYSITWITELEYDEKLLTDERS